MRNEGPIQLFEANFPNFMAASTLFRIYRISTSLALPEWALVRQVGPIVQLLTAAN